MTQLIAKPGRLWFDGNRVHLEQGAGRRLRPQRRRRRDAKRLPEPAHQFCHYGSAGQAILEGPGFKNVDFSVIKNIPVREQFRLQFRAEIFNIFNTPQFGTPVAGLNAATGFLPTTAGGAFPTQVTPSRGPGSITSIIAPMRQMQFGLKLLF
jgi:hypothetical protein